MSSLWENSRIRDNNCFYNSKTLSIFFMRLDAGMVSRPSWGARRVTYGSSVTMISRSESSLGFSVVRQ